MSDKLNLLKALKALAKAKQEDIKAVSKAEESIRQTRQEAEEKSSRQS